MSNGGCTFKSDPLTLVEVTGIELEVTGTGVKMGQRMTFCPGLDVSIHISGLCYLIV